MRLRLMFSFVLIVLVSVTAVVLLARQNATTAVRAFMYRGGMTGAGGLADTLENYYAQHGSWQGVEEVLRPGMHGRGAGSGQGGNQSGGMGYGMMLNQRLRLAAANGVILVDLAGSSQGQNLSSSEKSSALALEFDGHTVGYLVAEGGMQYSRADERLLVGRLSNAALTAGLFAGGIALLLALLLAYSIMRPVRELTQAARHLEQGDLSQRVRVQGSDELALLAHTFNRMAASLQQSEQARRALTADIAHELRNPLAVQRANLEALQDGLYALTPQALEPILEQNLLLTRLVEDLRTLALADAGQLKLEQVETDLASLAARVVERFRPQAEARQVHLLIQEPGAPLPSVVADPMRLEQILNNLLSNALRYTPDAGQVCLNLTARPGKLQLSVHDSGPGIPAEALEHIFERFYRAERARTRLEGNTGLGLAIARQIAEAHGGTLTAANHPQGGAVFTLTLPLKPPSTSETAFGPQLPSILKV